MHSETENKLLQKVDELSMIVTDLNLYLDTHPNDKAALDAFFSYNELLTAARSEYEMYCGPLTAQTAKPEQQWSWAVTPWPWQKECD